VFTCLLRSIGPVKDPILRDSSPRFRTFIFGVERISVWRRHRHYRYHRRLISRNSLNGPPFLEINLLKVIIEFLFFLSEILIRTMKTFGRNNFLSPQNGQLWWIPFWNTKRSVTFSVVDLPFDHYLKGHLPVTIGKTNQNSCFTKSYFNSDKRVFDRIKGGCSHGSSLTRSSPTGKCSNSPLERFRRFYDRFRLFFDSARTSNGRRFDQKFPIWSESYYGKRKFIWLSDGLGWRSLPGWLPNLKLSSANYQWRKC